MRKFLLTVTSPVSPIRVVPYSFNIEYSEYKHDVLTFIAPKASTDVRTPFVSGLPIRAQWACAPSKGEFYGYIDKVGNAYEPVGGALLPRRLTVRCLGVSYPMKSEDNETFIETTASKVLELIAKRFLFASAVQSHDVVWPALVQAGDSWWSFAIAAAKRVGYTLFMQDALLYAADRRTVLGNALAHRYNLSRRPHGVADVLLFEPTASSGSGLGDDAAPGAYVIHGKSNFSGAEFSQQVKSRPYTGSVATQQPLFQRVLNDSPRTLAEGQTYLNKAMSQNMFTQRATMRVLGNASLKVGSVISLNAPQDQIHDGTWFVLSAEHRIVADAYDVLLDIGKDASGFPFPSAPQSVSTQKRVPGVVFRNGFWTAAWSTT